jgi:hypothetical protein
MTPLVENIDPARPTLLTPAPTVVARLVAGDDQAPGCADGRRSARLRKYDDYYNGVSA